MPGIRTEPDEASRRRAMGLLILTAACWSFGGILIKWVQWHPMAISGMRSAVAALTVWVVFRELRFTWSRTEIGGAVAYAGTVTLFVVATKLTTAANAILLQYTAPVHVALFGPWFLGNLLAAAVGIPFMFGSMPDARSWAGLLLLGTVQMGIPYVLFSMAIRHVPAVTAILVPMIEPVLNPLWVLLLIGETPGPMAVAGGIVILGAVAARCIR